MRLARAGVVIFFGAIACAEQQRTESNTVLAVRQHTEERCDWTPQIDVAREGDGVGVRLNEDKTCTRTRIEDHLVRVDVKTRPDSRIFLAEVGLTVISTILIVEAVTCDGGSGDDYRENACYGPALGGGLGLIIGVPAAIATAIDALDFGSGSEKRIESKVVARDADVYDRRPAPGVLVNLDLSDGRTLRSTSDNDGRTWLAIPADAYDGSGFARVYVRIGSQRRSLRLNR